MPAATTSRAHTSVKIALMLLRSLRLSFLRTSSTSSSKAWLRLSIEGGGCFGTARHFTSDDEAGPSSSDLFGVGRESVRKSSFAAGHGDGLFSIN